jgi:hypothetical protein
MATKITRMLHLKCAHFKTRGKKDFVPPAIDALLLQVGQAAQGFAQRHYPPPSALPQGTTCAFIENIRKRSKGDGVMFDVNSYVYGLTSEQFHPNFSLDKPDINTGPIKDQNGKLREILHTYRCIALGQAVVVEYNRGAGGIGLLEALLSYVFHQHCQVGLPALALIDVTTSDLEQAIKAGGGVDSVSLKLVAGIKPPQGAYVAETLSGLRKHVKGAKQVSITWESNDEVLDSASVLKVAKEYAVEDSPLDKISIALKDGGSIPSLERYRERRRIDVTVSQQGTPTVTDIETGLRNYIDELRKLNDGWRVIDDNGNFVAPKVVSTKKT